MTGNAHCGNRVKAIKNRKAIERCSFQHNFKLPFELQISSNTYCGISFQKVASCYLSLVLVQELHKGGGGGVSGSEKTRGKQKWKNSNKNTKTEYWLPWGVSADVTRSRGWLTTLWRAGGECAITSTLTLLQHRLQTPAMVIVHELSWSQGLHRLTLRNKRLQGNLVDISSNFWKKYLLCL